MTTRERLYRLRWGQALVEKETHPAGARVIKDYSKCGFPGALIYGRLVPKREYHALHSLSGLEGIPEHARLQNPYTISYRYIEGLPLRQAGGKSPLPRTFFTDLWELAGEIHRRGFVHLDLGNSGNILVRDDASPAIIDFASCTSTRHFPRRLRRALEKRDRLGLLKLRLRYSPETMPPVMADYFNRHYHKHLATPTKLYKETRRCLNSRGLQGECGRVRRIWIIICVAVSIATAIGVSPVVA
ncbi:serine/threonine protein kinase [Marinobacter litoralis]|uniref:Serine/threonine protein kinase n=1 Tax=Marinobacter litoralis TaxID=187981 RepID=A0A3M2RKH5_9GAMM|nr:hypothetical protein [Marinobacter litoralis]RMJ05771.1 serine/threonine protein kinase [Marinobacter litoralis]